MRTSATVQTLTAIVLVFAVQMIGIITGELPVENFVFSLPVEVYPWTIVTAVYSHGGFGHLIGNAVALLIFGLLVERYTSIPRFHAFFLVTGIVAGFTELVVGSMIGVGMFSATGVIGASGAIFALMGYFLAGNIAVGSLMESINLKWKGKTLLVLGVAGLLTIMTAGEGIAIIAHFTGLVIGLISGRFQLLHK